MSRMSRLAPVSSIPAISREYDGGTKFFTNFLPAPAVYTLNDNGYRLLDNIVTVSLYGANITGLVMYLHLLMLQVLFLFAHLDMVLLAVVHVVVNENRIICVVG